jgi:hypothetical protein
MWRLKMQITNKIHVEIYLHSLGCPDETCHQIADGTSFAATQEGKNPLWVYIAGPMRGQEGNGFAKFDAVKELALRKGFNVISPADIDRGAGEKAEDDLQPSHVYVLRDFWALYFLARRSPGNGVIFIDGWTRSIGASAEFFLARWLGLPVYDAENVRGEWKIKRVRLAELLADFVSIRF